MKQKIVIDTNILVSALIQKGFSFKIIYDLVLEKKVDLCLSDEVWREYIEVLNRERFSKYRDFKANADIVLARLEELALKFKPALKIDRIKDEADNKFLELAVCAEVNFLITGNTNDFTFSTYEDIKIVTPRDYWQNHRKK
jgi:putative PIN family toxin of toxin-antitoxin system